MTISDADPDVRLVGGEIRSQEQPDDALVGLLQTANQALEPSRRPELTVKTVEPVDPDRDARAGLAFFAILLLYGQLIAYGYIVASGVVEEKASRVIEVLLATLKPRDLLAGKVLGLGVLGLTQLLLTAFIGVAVAGATGALTVDAALISAIALALVWFVLGYAFYASLYAAAGALVPRQEELQSTTTPLTMAILVAFFAGFAVRRRPEQRPGPRLRVHPVHRPDHDARPDRARRGAAVGDRGVGRGHGHLDRADDPVRRPDLRRGRDAHRVGGQAVRSAPARPAVTGLTRGAGHRAPVCRPRRPSA